MGAWGYKVLDNDAALDRLYEFFDEDKYYSAKIEVFLQNLLNSNLESSWLLYAAIVDTSIHGVDESLLGGYWDCSTKNKIFFEWLTLHPMPTLVPYALECIDKCIAEGVDDWREDVQEDRMNLYLTYKDKLSK